MLPMKSSTLGQSATTPFKSNQPACERRPLETQPIVIQEIVTVSPVFVVISATRAIPSDEATMMELANEHGFLPLTIKRAL